MLEIYFFKISNITTLQPEIKSTPSPRSEETTEPTPGTSGMQQKPESRERSVERYKSAEKATI